ncbi:hypothetical protein [Caballeronia humi]|uniref:Uncharacterized protein n=1 Tax=Caballeronia humi TaxID=326474 RepID=A0A158JD02_9BURK|nr:hypothetical protein [Caballeronia humi]SAL66734.1 hypothetical protein AWB65_06389 [Caballeronia humi]
MALRDSGKLHFLPVRLQDGDLKTPAYLKNLQYARLSDMGSPAEVVSRVKRLLADGG